MTSSIKKKKKNSSSNNLITIFKRGNYSLLRLLSIVNAAGPQGISTLKLLDKIGSRATYTQNVINRATKEGLIKRMPGKQPGPGQFPPVYNKITNKGKGLLVAL